MRNHTSTVTIAVTGLPLGPLAGLSFQERTASMAFFARSSLGALSTLAVATRPSCVTKNFDAYA